MTRKNFKRWLSNLVRYGALLWLVCHFTLTALYVMPLNPIKMRLQPFLDQTIGTYFPQNWSLFAPNPVSSDEAILVRCLDNAEVEAMKASGLPTTGWQDISTPLWERFQRNRFSAYDRLGRPQSNAVRAYMTGGMDLEPWIESCQKGSEQSCKQIEERLKSARGEAAVMLGKVGSAFCLETAATKDATHVAMRMRQTNGAPWSERYTPNRVTRDYELGVYPVDTTVATTGLFRTEEAK
jgi:hypothetical protein